jgi:hypothetical protein
MLIGFFWRESADGKDKRLAYRCLKCSVHYLIGDDETRIWCCNAFVPVPEQSSGFWALFERELPTESPVQYKSNLMTLRHPTLVYDED